MYYVASLPPERRDQPARTEEQVESGEGSIGAFLKDEELYDDLRELIRDLKHNPWKLIWKD